MVHSIPSGVRAAVAMLALFVTRPPFADTFSVPTMQRRDWAAGIVGLVVAPAPSYSVVANPFEEITAATRAQLEDGVPVLDIDAAIDLIKRKQISSVEFLTARGDTAVAQLADGSKAYILCPEVPCLCAISERHFRRRCPTRREGLLPLSPSYAMRAYRTNFRLTISGHSLHLRSRVNSTRRANKYKRIFEHKSRNENSLIRMSSWLSNPSAGCPGRSVRQTQTRLVSYGSS